MAACTRHLSPLCAAFVAVLLTASFCACAQTPTLQQQIAQHEQALATARSAADRKGEAQELNTLGTLCYQADQKQQALDFLNQALPILREAGDRSGEAFTLNNIGSIYDSLGQKQKALDFYNQSLPLLREMGDHSDEAALLNNIGSAYKYLGQAQKALDSFNQALPLRREAGDRRGEATTLNNIGSLYKNIGQEQKALDFFNQALLILRDLGDRRGEANVLNNIGLVYTNLGQKQKALDFYNQALPVLREAGDRRGEGATLNNIGQIYDDLGKKQLALDFYNQALPILREVGDRAHEAAVLNNIGSVYDDLGQKQKALDFYNQSLPILREVGDRSNEGNLLANIGSVYADLSQMQKALELYNQALPINREVGDRSGEAKTLYSIGKAYQDLGQKQQALDFYNQALPILREIGDRSGEAAALSNIGSVFDDFGQEQKALVFYNQALPIRREVGDRSGEAATLNNIGRVYSNLGLEQKALVFYNQALPIRREVGDRRGEAATVDNIGLVYKKLGQGQKALDFYNQSLPLFREVGDRSGEAILLDNIGLVYDDLGQEQKALDLLNQALSIQREIGNRNGEATTLNNLGRVYINLGEKQKALDFLSQALPLWRALGERNGEAVTLINSGADCDALGDGAGALRDFVAALSLARAVGAPDLEGATDDWLMRHFSDQQPVLAIHFGIEAVNSYQQIRKNITGLDKQLQAEYAKSKSDTYRTLAELLVVQNRLAEAEHVLDLVKDAELNETVRGGSDNPAAKTTPLPLSDADRAAEAGIAAQAATANDLTQAGFDYEQLRAVPAAQRTAAQNKQLAALSAKITAGNKALSDFFKTTLFTELGGAANSADANTRIADTNNAIGSVSQVLARLPAGTLALYTLIGDRHSYIIVTTARTRRSYAVNVDAATLGKLVLNLRQQLQSSSADPRPGLQQLDHLLLDPIAADLADAAKQSDDGQPTLLWSLDGNLRYIPVGALYDSTQPEGRKYLVERARSVVINSVSQTHLADTVSTDTLRVAALGVSNSYDGLPALSGVTIELDSVARDPSVPTSHGPLGGKVYANQAFTLPALENALGDGPAIVHIASHFVFKSGDGAESYLLLGGAPGSGPEHELTLSSFESTPELSFQNTRLVTLSACGTAEIGNAGNGREIDSLAMVLQRGGAASVLATLWSVDDASTSQLMSDFYRRWAQVPPPASWRPCARRRSRCFAVAAHPIPLRRAA